MNEIAKEMGIVFLKLAVVITAGILYGRWLGKMRNQYKASKLLEEAEKEKW